MHEQAKHTMLFLFGPRHVEPFLWVETSDKTYNRDVIPWRMRERMKTVSVALVVCLNIGTDPPDVVKTSPCARLECWIDPFSMSAHKALETVGNTLQKQYEGMQPRARYRQSLDPTVEDTKKLCISMRRNANNDRVLFHYTGHGVPRPTPNGEIWVFNKDYTQYMPLSVYDLQTWVGRPAIYVFDCSAAGILVSHFMQGEDDITPQTRAKETILLAACDANELLPMNPEFPADLFTSCLTTPIRIALRWFLSQNQLSMGHVAPTFVDQIPGKLNDRKTALGELNWIFTAITDTIAWNVLPRELFQSLFRQDLLVASLFRNFLLAERIMHSVNCTPISVPALPSTHQHPLWQAWDLAAEICLSQLINRPPVPSNSPQTPVIYEPSPFFAEQLTAFEVWLEFGHEDKKPPDQLPIVLQVLLSQVHRLRALVLLRRFLDLGPWAVNQALSVGIFPYVLKLLQSPARELRQVLVHIWAKILVLDQSCQADLIKDDGQKYFINHLAEGDKKVPPKPTTSLINSPVQASSSRAEMASEERVMCAFILTAIMHNHRQGQAVCLRQQLHSTCFTLLDTADSLLRRWLCFCLAKLWEGFNEAKLAAMHAGAEVGPPGSLLNLLQDSVPEVRAAATYALGHLIGSDVHPSKATSAPPSSDPSSPAKYEPGEGAEQQPAAGASAPSLSGTSDLTIGLQVSCACADGSPLVRREAILALQHLVLGPRYKPAFAAVANAMLGHQRRKAAKGPAESNEPNSARASDKSGGIEDTSVGNGSGAVQGQAQAAVDFESQQLLGPTDGTFWTDVGANVAVATGDDKCTAEKAVKIWSVIKGMQAEEPMPSIAQIASKLVKIIHLTIFSGGIPALSGPDSESSGAAGSASIPRLNDVSLPPMAVSASPNAPSFLVRRQQNFGNKVLSHHTRAASEIAPSNVETPAPAVGDQGHGGLRHSADQQAVSYGNFVKVTSPTQATRSLGGDGNNGSAQGTEMAEQLSQSKLYEWSRLYFVKPVVPCPQPCAKGGGHSRLLQFRVEDEDDDPLSRVGAARSARRRRNARVQAAAQRMAGGHSGGIQKIGQSAILDNDAEMTSLLLFHPYESALVVADEKDGISVWNYEEGEKCCCFSNSNTTGSRLTSLGWINPDDDALLLVSSDDGVVRVWHNMLDPGPRGKRLVTALSAVPDLVAGVRGSGLVTLWQQESGMLLAGGNSPQLRVWDLVREQCVMSVPTSTDACITSMATGRIGGGMVAVAGCGDGSLRLFDQRVRPQFSLMNTLKEHRAWVVHTHVHRDGTTVVSGSVQGDIRFWDLRSSSPSSTKTIQAHRTSMTALAAQNYAPVLASGSHNQFIKVFNLSGETLSTIRYHDGFLGQRIGPVSCLAFHPHKMFLAAGATDSIVSLYTGT